MATEPLTDEILLLRIKEGDHNAFAILVTRHNIKFYNLAFRYMASREEAEDVVQMCFLKLWENPDIWQEEKGAKFTTWFYRIIVNTCLDKHKRHKTIDVNEEFEVADERDNQEISAAKNQEQKLLAGAIKSLPKRQKTALILCFYEELSQQEAADIMKVNIKALQSLVMRAKATLKDKLKNYA